MREVGFTSVVREERLSLRLHVSDAPFARLFFVSRGSPIEGINGALSQSLEVAGGSCRSSLRRARLREEKSLLL